jgi:hypothetical protein
MHTVEAGPQTVYVADKQFVNWCSVNNTQNIL